MISKCYRSVFNKRLVSWAEENVQLSDTGAGFRQGYSTTGHIVTLNATVKKTTTKRLPKRGGKLYTCFVDLKKALESLQKFLICATKAEN